MEQNTKVSLSKKEETQGFDLLELLLRVWTERKLVLKCCGIAVVLGLIVGFSTPKEYTTTVTLAPEFNSSGASMSGLSSLAGLAGINLRQGTSRDALYPTLYPDIVSSVPFATELFPVPVESLDGQLKISLFEYLKEHQRTPWWGAVTGFPSRIIGWVTSLFKEDKEDEQSDESKVNPFHLTRAEAGVVSALSNRIAVAVDKKTYVVTINVTMQDPLIAATVTDTVLVRLQNYITNYRTSKARGDLKFTQKLYEEAQADYNKALQAYADFVDMNQNLSLRSVQTRQIRLQNEMNLAYEVYTQTAQQLQLAKAKVQESTPAYTVVQTATVPLRPSGPSKLIILIGFLFLAGMVSVGWILFGRAMVGFLRLNGGNAHND